jgi:hypothetical protein
MLKLIEILRQRWASDTYRAIVIGAVLTFIEANLGLVSSLIPEQYRPYMPLVWPLVMAYYREQTKEPLSAK